MFSLCGSQHGWSPFPPFEFRSGYADGHSQGFHWWRRRKDSILARRANLSRHKSAPDVGCAVFAFVGLYPSDRDRRSSHLRSGLIGAPHLPDSFALEVVDIYFFLAARQRPSSRGSPVLTSMNRSFCMPNLRANESWSSHGFKPKLAWQSFGGGITVVMCLGSAEALSVIRLALQSLTSSSPSVMTSSNSTMLVSPFLMRRLASNWLLRPRNMALRFLTEAQQRLLSALRRCGALDINPVGFFKGSPESVCWPS